MSNKIIIADTAVASWQNILSEIQAKNSIYLGDELESYMVFMLMRFVEKFELVDTIVSMDILASQQLSDNIKEVKLRDVGDSCLIFAGLFPGRAYKRNVKNTYYVEMGQLAYSMLSNVKTIQLANVYSALANNFPLLVRLLKEIRIQG